MGAQLEPGVVAQQQEMAAQEVRQERLVRNRLSRLIILTHIFVI
jgi:hypothetical protein